MPGIVLITTSYPDEVPGTEAAGSFVEDFAIELSKSTAVTVLAASREASVSISNNLTVRRFAVPRQPLSLLKPYKPTDWRAVFATLRSGRKAIGDLIDDERPDHVLALWALPSGWWADTEATRRGVPFSTWALGSDIWSLGRIPLIRNKLADVLRNARYRYADGLELCADVERLCGMPCTFLPSTRRLVATRATSVGHQAPYKLAFLGRWHPNKGTDLLMQSLQALEDEDWDRIEEVRIFGGGQLAGEIEAAANQLAAAQRPVTTGGYLDKDEAAALIGWADYMLLPSRIESIPVIFSDAMQLGTPIVATPVGDLPRLHARYVFGVLSRAASVDAFADAIRQATRQDAAGFAPGVQQARADFDLATIAAQFLADIGTE
jgi:glycosyltransferase involved in cell wall biosynthesis